MTGLDGDPSPRLAQNETLGVASSIYVVSLPRRTDRRATMERLRQALSLTWTYIDAVQPDDLGVINIMNHVRTFRERSQRRHDSPGSDLVDSGRFDWINDSDFDSLVRSRASLGLTGSDFWTSQPLANNSPASSDDLLPLTCATTNLIDGPAFSSSIPAHMVLTTAKIACWYSHLEVIRRPTSLDGSLHGDDVSVILEDDVDMERDIRERLLAVWHLLPREWDIVFLGHCWSNESFHSPVADNSPAQNSTSLRGVSLHPSFAPRCTHAYALTTSGARRLLLHLRHPPFAYSRAFDQALSWLVSSGRLKAFSIVPSVVVQRKIVAGDIDPGARGTGSTWRDHLLNGVF
ncbi:hypothetical protein BKA93DRAFT_744693 [Sparassis latifolia]